MLYKQKPQSFTLSTIVSNEKEKKRTYNQRVIQVEHGSFTPLVFSAHGGCGREAQHFVTSLVEKIAKKRDMPSSVISNYVRTKIAFSLIRSLVNCIRGTRSRYHHREVLVDVAEIEVSEKRIIDH